MKTHSVPHVIGVPVQSITERTPKMLHCKSSLQYHSSHSSNGHLAIRQNKPLYCLKSQKHTFPSVETVIHGISDALKRNMNLGAKILRAGRSEKIFKFQFNVKEGEKLLNFFQCYLSTTAGPIKGHLFISTDKLAFCSEKSIKFSSSDGNTIRIRYKVSIPVGKIFQANESCDMNTPSQKYIQIVTLDNFDFWFMGFLGYQKTLKSLRKNIFGLS